MSEGKKFDGDYMEKPPLDMLPPKAMIDLLNYITPPNDAPTGMAGDLSLAFLNIYSFQRTGRLTSLLAAAEHMMDYCGRRKAIEGAGQVMGFGAQKYAPGNYLLIKEPRRYVAAALRHLMLFDQTEPDAQSGIEHKYHVFCNILLAYEAIKNHGNQYLYAILEQENNNE